MGGENESVRTAMKNDTDGEAVDADDASASTDPTDVRYVGPATASVVADAQFDAAAIPAREVSYDMLVEAGVNPGVAARLRREHSLSWSFSGSSDDLEDRSNQVRGLRDDERAWVAASSGDWESKESPTPASTDGSGDATAAEAAWRDRSRPDPATDVPDIDETVADELAEAGITSVRSMAVADPGRVADLLSFDHERVVRWRDAARELQ